MLLKIQDNKIDDINAYIDNHTPFSCIEDILEEFKNYESSDDLNEVIRKVNDELERIRQLKAT